jgi:hypothetical protein
VSEITTPVMAIHLKKPYRIIPTRVKRYETHYNVPAEYVLVVPQKIFGEEVLCDMRWEDKEGILHVIHNAMFVFDNLIPLNQLPDTKLQELWDHYYSGPAEEKPSSNGKDSHTMIL